MSPKKEPLLDDARKIIDANFNRAKEGLRVCEDIARFHLKDPSRTRALGRLRHALTSIIKQSTISHRELLNARETSADPCKSNVLGPARKSIKGLFAANAQRVKEALRVLEEFSKLFDAEASRRLQRLRFQFYDFEKETAQRYPALLDS